MNLAALRKSGLILALTGVLLILMVEPALATATGFQTPLISDKGVQVGWVSVTHAVFPPAPPGNLLVTYHLFSPWHLQSVQVAASGDVDGLPVNRTGNPVPGLFPWKPLVPANATSYTVVIPVNQTDLTGGGLVYFAAHATFTNGLRTYGAWGQGTAFDGARNGGMWFTVSCTNPG